METITAQDSPVKAYLGAGITNLFYRLSGHVGHINIGLGTDLTRQHYHAGV